MASIATKKRKPKAPKDELTREAESLLVMPMPIFGDVRDPDYYLLLNEACLVLYARYFEQNKKSPWMAACCKAWGEKKSLEDKNHDHRMMLRGRDKAGLNIQDQADLWRWIVGEEPVDQDQKWEVQFPRTAGECTKTNRNESNWFKTDLKPSQYLVFGSDQFLGKRKVLNFIEEQCKESANPSEGSSNLTRNAG